MTLKYLEHCSRRENEKDDHMEMKASAYILYGLRNSVTARYRSYGMHHRLSALSEYAVTLKDGFTLIHKVDVAKAPLRIP